MLPERIKCGPLDIAVTLVDDMQKRLGVHSYGFLDFDEIRIQADISAGRQVWHLWTQLANFMFNHMATDLTTTDKDRLARMLFAIVRDNPAVINPAHAFGRQRVRIAGLTFDIVLASGSLVYSGLIVFD